MEQLGTELKRAREASGISIHDRLHIVIRPVLPAFGIASHGLVAGVLGGVPAAVSEIETSDECDGIVHDDDFLMMRCAERMLVVQAEVQAPMRAPVELVYGQPFAIEREDHREIPGKDMHLQAAPA